MKLRNNFQRWSLVGLPLVACAAVSPVYAIEFGTSAQYTYQTSNNIDRVTEAEGTADGATHQVIGGLTASTRAQWLDLDLDLMLGLSQSDGLDAEQNSDIGLSLYALFNLRPGQISWLLADYALEQGNDLAELADSDERFLTNSFITGPMTTWRVTPVDDINADLYYMLGDQENESEQTRQLALLTNWSHRFSRTISLGLHVENTDTSFKESDDEFGIRNIFARYTYEHGKTALDVDVGTSGSTDFEPADNSESSNDESLFGINFSRQMSRSTTLTFDGSQQFTDQSARSLEGNLSTGLNTGLGPFYENRWALGYTRAGNIWNAGVGLSSTGLEYVDAASQEDDREEIRASFGLGYALNTVWGLNMAASLAGIDYYNVIRQDDETQYSVGVSYQISATLGTAVDASFSSIDSNFFNDLTGVQEDELIEEMGVSFSIYWRPITRLGR